MTLEEFTKRKMLSALDLELVERLKQFSSDNDYIIGVLLDVYNEDDKQALLDYIENGNIVNSVNMPAVSMGRTSDARVCVIHKNVPGIISAITTALADQNINVHNMQNASKGDYAYTLLDVETVFDGIEDKLMAVENIIRVRVIK